MVFEGDANGTFLCWIYKIQREPIGQKLLIKYLTKIKYGMKEGVGLGMNFEGKLQIYNG